MQFDFPALGTQWWIEVWDAIDEQLADEAERFVRQFVSEYEAAYSRFKPDSQISILNQERVLTAPSTEMRSLLSYGTDAYRRTRGVFNLLTGHILEARGYDGAYSFIDKGSTKLTPGNPLTDLVITDEKIELLFGNVDIGGYGKGWLIDRLGEQLRDRFGLVQFLINGGGDIFVTHQSDKPVTIYLEDPQRPGTIVGSTLLQNRAFAASSPHKRRWPIKNADGAEQHHIVSNQPVKDIIYLTAPNATDADMFATTLLQVDQHTAANLASQNQLTLLL